MRAVIVASGPSARGFQPYPGIMTIAVNGAADVLPRADLWFSLDASVVNQRRLAERRLTNCVYVTCGPYWVRKGDLHMTRVDSLKTRGRPPAHGTPEWWFWRLGCVAGINREAGHINTGNSAWGALGLAHHLGFKDVALIGVDANNEPRCEGGRSKNLSHLPMLFASAANTYDGRVVCCGAMEAPGIPRMTLEEWKCS